MSSVAGALVAGLIFGLGLLLAGMTNPDKVLGFLDIAGAWDPSLALVMVGGIAVARMGLLLVRRRGARSPACRCTCRTSARLTVAF